MECKFVICVFSRQTAQQLLIRLWYGKQNDTSVSIVLLLLFSLPHFSLCCFGFSVSSLPLCASVLFLSIFWLFILRHCTWNALFSIHIDYQPKSTHARFCWRWWHCEGETETDEGKCMILQIESERKRMRLRRKIYKRKSIWWDWRGRKTNEKANERTQQQQQQQQPYWPTKAKRH